MCISIESCAAPIASSMMSCCALFYGASYFSVVVTLACPRNCETLRMSTPALSSSTAAVFVEAMG